MGSTVEDEISDHYRRGFLDDEAIEFIKRVIENKEEDGTTHILPKEAAREVLTGKRIELITTLREEEVSSKRELARKLDRDIKNVSEDLDLLWKHSIINYKEGKGTSKIPEIAADEIIIEPI